jgi:hypothetical protein
LHSDSAPQSASRALLSPNFLTAEASTVKHHITYDSR